MQYQANDFLCLRTLIIRNSVLNTLLTASLSGQTSDIVVGMALIKLDGKLRDLIIKSKGEKCKLPNYVMVNIVVTLGLSFSIGYRYQSYPTIWVNYVSKPNKGHIACLKHFAKVICETYSLHSTKIDKIFSKLPQSLNELLKSNKISPNYWRAGYSKKISGSVDKISEVELEVYYVNLKQRLNDWRYFNQILIQLLKNGEFAHNNPNFGTLTVNKTPLDKRIFLSFKPTSANGNASTIATYNDLNPVDWEKLNCEIDTFTLRNLFKEQGQPQKQEV